MSDLPSPELLVEMLHRQGYRARRKLGQHFLTDEEILDRIADLTEADDQTLAVEIGPGPMGLTRYLVDRAGLVLAVERDERLRDYHARLTQDVANLRFVYGDALQIDLQELAREALAESKGGANLQRAVLTGNLPFQITSPLLFAQCTPDAPWSRIVVMVQKEVANRIMAKPHTKDYGILTVKLAYWYATGERFDVAASKFTPPPRVDASVVTLEPLAQEKRPDAKRWRRLSRFIDLCFNQRRKKLYNAPLAGFFEGFEREDLKRAMDQCGIDPNVRSENLAPPQFDDIFTELETRVGPPQPQGNGEPGGPNPSAT